MTGACSSPPLPDSNAHERNGIFPFWGEGGKGSPFWKSEDESPSGQGKLRVWVLQGRVKVEGARGYVDVRV